MKLQPIVSHLFLVPGAARGQFPFAHCVLADSSPVTLIDAGCGLGSLDELVELSQPEQVIISHSHPDHCAGCSLLEDLPIHVPKAAAQTFGDKDKLAERFFGRDPVGEQWKSFVTGAMGFENCSFTDTYADGDQFRLGDMTFVAIAAPGHSADHMALFEAATGVLISFDIDLTPFGPWYGNPESDIGQLRRSIQNLADLEPRVVVTSHMGIIRKNIQEAFNRYLHVIDARHGAIAELVSAGCDTIDALVGFSPIYGRHEGRHAALTRWWERAMIQKHLDMLEAEDRIRRRNDGHYEALHPGRRHL